MNEDGRAPGASQWTVLRARASRWSDRIRRAVVSRDIAGLTAVLFGGIRHRRQRAAPVEAVLFRTGRYIHRGRSGAPTARVVRRFRLPDGVERVGGTGVLIDLDRLTTYCGFSFAPGGWHPFLELIREYDADPSLHYEDSVLHRLYTRFTPATVQQAVFDDAEALHPLDRLPADRRLLRRLWALDAREVAGLVRRGVDGPLPDAESRYFGPKARDVGARHFRKVLDLHRSVQQHGYDPVRFGGERPKGYFVVRGGEYRFVVGHANRRLAGVHAAGIREVVVSFFEHVPPVIEEEDLDRWSTRHGGVYPPAVAMRLFDRLFTATGAERAEVLGLR